MDPPNYPYRAHFVGENGVQNVFGRFFIHYDCITTLTLQILRIPFHGRVFVSRNGFQQLQILIDSRVLQFFKDYPIWNIQHHLCLLPQDHANGLDLSKKSFGKPFALFWFLSHVVILVFSYGSYKEEICFLPLGRSTFEWASTLCILVAQALAIFIS